MQKNINPTNDSLQKGHCVPCEGGTAPLTDSEENMYHEAVPNWSINRDNLHTLTKEFIFKNFMDTISAVNKIATLAEDEGHHPNLYIHDYKKLKIELTTHAIKGLSTNDFILASKIEKVLQ